MSLATLKKKTNAQYRTLSANTPQFSLNGTHRSQGYIGQSTQSRFMIRTLMKGNVIRGHGGAGGAYPVHPIIQDLSTFNTNNNSVIKPSVLGTKGMMDTKYRWIRRPQPFSVLKSDNNNNLNDQGQYLANIQQQTLAEVNSCNGNKDVKPIMQIPKTCGCDYVTYKSNFRKAIVPSDPTKIDKYRRSQNEYLASKLYLNCQSFNPPPVLNKKAGVPFACKTFIPVK